jgi:two-component system phosphate regulon sensor histidine kinase PhoR
VLYDITELRRLENMRREFVTNVSHELKTPLSSIKAYAETLRLGALHDAEHNLLFVERIEEQAERLHQLILDLLHLARVESGKEAFEIRDVSVTEVVQQRADDYRERAAAKGLDFHLELPAAPATARADRTGLATILDNLVSNAIQYTPEGGSVRVRVQEETGWIELAVEDTGLGIAARDQQRIFERFYRVDKARSRELGGTGLGLAIVKHLAQAFNGQVGLVSELGTGSTFWVRLPRPR